MSHVTHNGGGMSGELEQLTDNEYHELLAVGRRRTTLDILADSNTPVELEELAATVAERENSQGIADKAIIERVAISLHHSHLPKMADLGIIDYDPD